MDVIERRDALVSQLRRNGEEALAALRVMQDDAFDAGRYENGWSARQILAHVAAIEWTYPRMLELPSLDATSAAGGETHRNQSGAVRSRMDDYNARQVEKRATASIAELVEEFERNRAATIAAIASADAETLSRRVQSFGGLEGELIDVIAGVVVDHVGGHIRDITGDPAT